MFKPNPSAVRTIPRSFRSSQFLHPRRTLHNQTQRADRTNGQKITAAFAGTLVGIAAYQMLGMRKDIHAEAPRLAPEEKMTKINLQHIQVQSSLENPGVYAWGDNSGKVIAPDSKEKVIKTPRRLHFFDGTLLRDLQLSHNAGVAVNDKGDILQWGTGYSAGIKVPETTLKGKNIERVVLTKDKIIALSKDKTIYSLPISKQYQQEGFKPTESSWIPGLSSTSEISYRILKPDLSYLEKVTDIAAGRDHLLVLTSRGRVFSSASAFQYPDRGQMGIPGLTYNTRPAGKPYDILQEITALKDHKISQIAAGDYHSVVLSTQGKIFTFGDNVHGQLGFEYNPDTNIIDVPTPLSLSHLYPTTPAAVTSVAAGGSNTYFTVDSSSGTHDVLSCGTGIHGNLGNGRWTHVQGPPSRIKALSGLQEFNEATQKMQPIHLHTLSVGGTHVAAVMGNNTSTSTSGSYGTDVLWWGNNEFYQLGTGKRNNSNVPVYIQPLDGAPAELADGTGITGSSSRVEPGRVSGIIGGVGNEDSGRAVTGNDQVHRFQLTPEGNVKGKGKAVQTVICGRGNTAVFMRKL
ncbi:RCC1/BLIP-II [Wilcoxina mikolae CBS 423.85]|nr:RCC1/BLIP-II [Wilcoxina mikolae CBS 423.85]